MDKIEHILERFDKNDFKDISDWKSKFYNNDLVMYYDDMYIPVQEAFSMTVVKRSDMRKF